MSKLLLNLMLLIADLLGINWILRRLTNRSVRILMYHGVTARPVAWFYWTSLDRERFEWQMDYLTDRYPVISFASLIGKDGESSAAGCRTVITFDDGLENTFHEAWPILKQRHLKATCFVVPLLSETGSRIWADEIHLRLMAAKIESLDLSQYDLGVLTLDLSPNRRSDQVNELLDKLKNLSHTRRTVIVAHLVESCNDLPPDHEKLKLMTKQQIITLAQSEEFDIGGHSNSHPILSTMTPDKQHQEIAACFDTLRSWEISPLFVVAYPNGRPEDYNDDTIGVLKQAGVKAAVTTVDGLHDPSDDPFQMKRIAIGANINRWEFKARLSGLYYFIRRCVNAAGK